MPEHRPYPFPALKPKPRVIEAEFIDEGRPVKKAEEEQEELIGEIVEQHPALPPHEAKELVVKREAMSHALREAVEKYGNMAKSLGESKAIGRLVDRLI